MRLNQLLNEIPTSVRWQQISDIDNKIDVQGITFDSRLVKPGYIFVAVKGVQTDGHRHISSAINNGAIAIVGTRDVQNLQIPYIQVPNSRFALALLSAAFYGYPARSLTVIGVTGTDGKTTTATIIYNILKAASFHAGLITTVRAEYADQSIDTGFHVTTPEAPDIQKYLRLMKTNQPNPVSHVVIESTSHGLDQQRLVGCDFDIGVITNITHEHLDYHGSMDAYRNAKATLFRMLAETTEKERGNVRLAVLNHDDSSYEFLSSLVSELNPCVRQISFGTHPQADFRAEDIQLENGKQHFRLLNQSFQIPIEMNLLGLYNVSNCLAAIAVTLGGLRVSEQNVLKGISETKDIPGRLEQIQMGQKFLAIIDFAHTPNAIMNSLQVARGLCKGKLISIFGSAGLRDKEKRRLMAKMSIQLADFSIFTAEDPRTESLDEILKEMGDGAESIGAVEGKDFIKIADRREALRYGVKIAGDHDLVIAFGKGHEQSMCFGEIEYPWDDRIAMKSALAERLGIVGPAMPYLPN